MLDRRDVRLSLVGCRQASAPGSRLWFAGALLGAGKEQTHIIAEGRVSIVVIVAGDLNAVQDFAHNAGRGCASFLGQGSPGRLRAAHHDPRQGRAVYSAHSVSSAFAVGRAARRTAALSSCSGVDVRLWHDT
jgi:hypothetical protein